MSTHHSDKDTSREPRGMGEVVDWIMLVGGALLALLFAKRGWDLGLIFFCIYMFLFAIARFVVALFRRRKAKR